MDVSKHPIVFLRGTVISMTFSRTEDGSVLVLKAVEREVKEGDKPAVKACRMYLNGKLINQEVEGPVEDIVEFDQVCWEMFQKMDLNEGLKVLHEELMKAQAAAAVEVEEEETEGGELEEDLYRKWITKAQAVLGKESRAIMIRAHTKTLKAELFEEEDDCQEEEDETEAKGCMKLFRKLGIKGQKKKEKNKKQSPQKSETEEKRSTKDASTNTRLALELKDVSEKFHH